MARSFDDIKSAIKTKVRTYSSLDSFLFPEDGGSKLSIFNLFIDVMAAMIFLSDSIWAAEKNSVQQIANTAFSGNAQWVRQQILNFQYGDVITLDADYIPTYTLIDESKQIIERCAVTERTGGGINIKVAKDDGAGGLTSLTTPELDALKDYYFGTSTAQGVGFAGIVAGFISEDADRMKVAATVYYYGQYDSATVKTNVIAAIDNFFATFADTAFDGTVFMIRLTDAIQAVAGVSRVVYTEVKARDAGTALASAGNIDFQGFYQTVSGYIISEDTAGSELTDTITMTLETL